MTVSTAEAIQSFETRVSRWRGGLQASAADGPNFSASGRPPAISRCHTAAGGSGGETLRDLVGDFVGNVFYGTLLRELQNSTIKGKYLHGGRGEDVFRGQLNMELAKRMGRAPNDPIANHMHAALTRFYRIDSGADSSGGASAGMERGVS